MQWRIYRGTDDTPDEYYKPVITIPFLDHLLQVFLKRFTSLQQRATMTILLFPPVDIALNDMSVNFIREDLPSDYHCYRTDQSTIDDLIKECDPNVHTIRWIAITCLTSIGLVKSD